MTELKVDILSSKSVFRLSLGNVLNTANLVLFLPSVALIYGEFLASIATAMVFGQVLAVFANYSFYITIPRKIEAEPQNEKAIVRSLSYFQFLLGLVGFCFVTFVNSFSMLHIVLKMMAFFLVFVPVVTWQWYHIVRPFALPLANSLIITRVLMLALQMIVILKIVAIDTISQNTFLIIGIIFLFLTIYPIKFTIQSIGKTSENPEISIQALLGDGRRVFYSSIMSTVYLLGPSLVFAIYGRIDIAEIAQFDRVRFALSGFIGMLTALYFPGILKMSNFKKVSLIRKILPVIIVLLIGMLGSLTIMNFYSASVDAYLSHLKLSVYIGSLALIAVAFAGLSNITSLLFLLSDNRDSAYLKCISAGSIVFIFMVLFRDYLFNDDELLKSVIFGAVTAEGAILIALLIATMSRKKLH